MAKLNQTVLCSIIVYQFIFEEINFCVFPKVKHSRKIFSQMTHVDTKKGVVWQHFLKTNFRDKCKKCENLVP